jgi:hypothetical protein
MLKQRNCIARRDVLAQHDHAGTRVMLPGPGCRLDALIGAGRRHPDVRHHDIGPLALDQCQQSWQVPSGTG